MINLPDYNHFSFPSTLKLKERVTFCLDVINRYRRELPRLRSAAAVLKRQKQRAEEQANLWQQKYHEEKHRREQLEKETERLKEEINRLTKTSNRYRASLFDHGNFKTLNPEDKKAKGGQPGHPDTNREQRENPQTYAKKRVFASRCPDCGLALGRVSSVKRKILVDIVLNPQAVKLLIESERQWCSSCQKEVGSRDCRSLPFTEYGINTFMMVLLLRYRCLLPLSKISQVLKTGYGLDISPSGLVSLFRQAKAYLGYKYEDLKQSVRQGRLMYNDETGWQVKGKNAWMWIMADENTTVYAAAESRGKGIARELYGNSRAYSMHDGYGSYTNSIPPDKHLYCWAHLLRFCFEETADKPPDHESIRIRDGLVSIYHRSRETRPPGKSQAAEWETARQIDRLLGLRVQDAAAKAILHRLRCQRDGLIRSLFVSPNGTNNLAEQELRPIALSRKISFGSDTYTGMETTAILASVVQTLYRTNRDQFFPLLEASLRAGFVKS